MDRTPKGDTSAILILKITLCVVSWELE